MTSQPWEVGKAALQEPETQDRVTDSVNDSETVEPSRVVTIIQVALRNIVDAKVESRINVHINVSIADDIAGTSMNVNRQATDSVPFEKKSTLNGFIDISISRMIKS